MAESGGNNVMTAYWSGGISKNPYLSFTFTGGAKGDEVKITWKDNQGGTDSGTAKIK
jgi:sulfur-oxidizing protein SoxZ